MGCFKFRAWIVHICVPESFVFSFVHWAFSISFSFQTSAFSQKMFFFLCCIKSIWMFSELWLRPDGICWSFFSGGKMWLMKLRVLKAQYTCGTLKGHGDWENEIVFQLKTTFQCFCEQTQSFSGNAILWRENVIRSGRKKIYFNAFFEQMKSLSGERNTFFWENAKKKKLWLK